MNPKELSKTTPTDRATAKFYQVIFRDLTKLERLEKRELEVEQALEKVVAKLDAVCPE